MFEGLRKGAGRGHAEAALNDLSGRGRGADTGHTLRAAHAGHEDGHTLTADIGQYRGAVLVASSHGFGGQWDVAGSGQLVRAPNATSGQASSAGNGQSMHAALEHEDGQNRNADSGYSAVAVLVAMQRETSDV